MTEADKIAKWRAELPPLVIQLLDAVKPRCTSEHLLTALVSAAFVAGKGAGLEEAQKIFARPA